MILAIALPVLKRKKYGLIALAAAALMAGISYYLTVAKIAFKSIVIAAQMNGFWFIVFSLLTSLIISVLLGVYLGMLFFRHDLIKDKKNPKHFLSGAGGTATGILAAGCPSCGAPLFTFFGAPFALSVLPFQGLEIKILSILLLWLSIYLLAENITNNLKCAAPIQK